MVGAVPFPSAPDMAAEAAADVSADTRADATGSDGAVATDWSLGVPAPGRIDAATVRRGAGRMGRWLILSPRAGRLPPALVALLAAGWAAAVGWLLCGGALLLSAVEDPQRSLVSLIWLTAHHAGLDTPTGTVTLLPLGLLLLTVLPLRRAGRFVAAHTDSSSLRLVAPLAVLLYSALAGMAAATSSGLPRVGVVPAVGWAAVVAAVAGLWGVVRQLRGRLPCPPFAVGVLISVGMPLAVGALLLLVTLVTSLSAIAEVQSQVTTSGVEQLALGLLQLAYLPNLIVWAGSFVVGSGFSVGADHVLSPFSSAPPVVPDLPLLAALPVEASKWTAILPIVVAVSGALGAVAFARLLPEPRLRRRITRAVALSAASGAAWWLLTALTGGSLGDGRLDSVGPVSGTALLATLLTGAGTLLWALLPTLASDARPVAVDLRERVATAAKDPRIPVGKRG